jgi:hypothetical protein
MRTAEPHGTFRSRDAAVDAQLQGERSRHEVDAGFKAALVPPYQRILEKELAVQFVWQTMGNRR